MREALPTSLEHLRDLHLQLALDFESRARTTCEGEEVWYFLDKQDEAFDGALFFQGLIDQGVTEIPVRADGRPDF